MNCLQVEEYFSAHYEDTLDYQTLKRFESHIDECASCDQEYSLFCESIQASQELPQIEPSPAFNSILQQRLADEEREKPSLWQRVQSSFVLPRWAYGLAFLLVLASSASFLYFDDLFNGNTQSEINGEFISTQSPDSLTQYPSEINHRFLPRSFGGAGSSFTTSSRPMQQNYVLKHVSYTTSSTAGGL